MNALDEIIAYKREEVRRLRSNTPLAALEAMAREAPPVRGFSAALDHIVTRGQNALICEFKRRSPSAGTIAADLSPEQIVRDYAAGGAACLSILTDQPSFGGCLGDLRLARNACDLPILRKDFVIDPVQVIEARAYGADAVLVIMAAVEDTLAAELIATARMLALDVLVEVHNAAELTRALDLGATFVGINNRDLKAMQTDLSVTESLASKVPPGVSIVSESGISGVEQVRQLRRSGVSRFLIGEWLMKLGHQRPHTVAALRMAVD